MNTFASDSPRPILLLVDGSSYLYRAFHAMPDLRAVPGDPSSPATGAIRGMVNMMQALQKEHPADCVACVFDASGPTFRDALYPEYKAHRSPMPDDLRAQLGPCSRSIASPLRSFITLSRSPKSGVQQFLQGLAQLR